MARLDTNCSAMDAYLHNIGRIPLLTKEEEIHLGRSVQRMVYLKEESTKRPLTRKEKQDIQRGERAKQRFVQANLRLVVHVVKKGARYYGFVEKMDLIQECTIGLMRAVDKFDPQRGYKFSTYAYWWCRQAIQRSYHAHEHAIRRPTSVCEMSARVAKLLSQETQRLGRTPTLSELSEVSGVAQEELELLATRGSACVGLDTLTGDEDSSTYVEMLRDEDCPTADEIFAAMDRQEYLQMALEHLDKLDDRERRYVTSFFGLGGCKERTFTDMGKEDGVSRENVRRVTRQAIDKLRTHMNLESFGNTSELLDEAPTAGDPPRRSRGKRKPLTALAVFEGKETSVLSTPTLLSA